MSLRKLFAAAACLVLCVGAGCGGTDLASRGGQSPTGQPAPDPNKNLKAVKPPKGSTLPQVGGN